MNVVQVDHLFDVRLEDQLDATILLLIVLRLRLHRARDGSVSPKPEAAQCFGSRPPPPSPAPSSSSDRVALRRDQEQKNLARARERKAPVVVERTARRILLVVGVTGDLEVATRQIRVAANDFGDLHEDVFSALLQLVFARVEEDVARQLDDHAVVAHDDLEADLRELVETAL